ncbi:hypothetical protein Hsw_3355 [Hymenobacter swuensis DY53]|uniref:Uncharacterized protein n=1 Tax=Hymenobacter swuensis DY53 TaxID=1227739 RepID=W8FBA7_9BACT|nr:hypothetical protein Hsw_3355 [Hymenobacter swuensis DY53]
MLVLANMFIDQLSNDLNSIASIVNAIEFLGKTLYAIIEMIKKRKGD